MTSTQGIPWPKPRRRIVSKQDHEDLKSTAPMTVGRVVPANGRAVRTPEDRLRDAQHEIDVRDEENPTIEVTVPGWPGNPPSARPPMGAASGEKRAVDIPGWTGPTGHPPATGGNGDGDDKPLFPNMTKLPDLEVRRVFLAAENEYVWAVVADLRISRFTDDDTWSADFKVLATFVDTLDGAQNARNWMDGYIQGIARIVK